MSSHASAASADLAAQNDLDSDNKRTLLHDSKPDHAEIQSESYEESAAEIHSESKRKPDAEIHSEIKRKPDADIQLECDEEYKKMPVGEIHSEGESKPVADQSEGERKPVAEINSKRDEYSDRDIGQQRELKEWIKQAGFLDNIKGDADDPRRSSSDVSIVTVPEFLKRTKEEAYVPQTVSLGSLHHSRGDLRRMDPHKARALRRMVTRLNMKLEVFVYHAMEAILKLDDKIRNSYEGKISCKREDLAWMLCLDGCFILEVLKTLGRDKNESYGPNDGNDPIFGENKFAASNILKDILMIENQIPWVVLLELQRLENSGEEDVETMLSELLVKGTCCLFNIPMQWMSWRNPNQEVHHVLGFLHKVIVHQANDVVKRVDQGEDCNSIERCIGHCLLKLQDKNMNHEFQSIPHAVELKNAGIKFLPLNGGISGIMFSHERATIYLPPVSITYATEVLFRNLIAFESCRPSEINYVTNYVNLMDDLIDSPKDVALLRSKGILTNLLGSDKEVADLFNGLCKDVGTENMENVFDEVKKEVNAHYKNKIRVQLAELVRDHFSSPWKAFAWAAAIFMILLTLIQAIFTILSYYKKK